MPCLSTRTQSEKVLARMTRFTQTAQIEEEGLIYVSRVINTIGWIWREVLKHDMGIDGYVEVVERATPTQQLIALQVKSGDSYIQSETPSTFRFVADVDHLRYWLQSPIPVVLVVYSPSRATAYWVHIQSLQLQIGSNAQTKSFVFPKQPFDFAAGDKLVALPLKAGARVASEAQLTFSFAESPGERKYPMIPVILGGRTKATSVLGLVDTGADSLALPATLADYLGLKRLGTAHIRTATGAAAVQTARVELRVPGGKAMKATCVIADNLPAVILGRSPLFDEHQLEIDYLHGTVSLTPNRPKAQR